MRLISGQFFRSYTLFEYCRFGCMSSFNALYNEIKKITKALQWFLLNSEFQIS